MMASRQVSNSRKAEFSKLKAADSPASSTTSSSKPYPETSVDSPTTSSARNKPLLHYTGRVPNPALQSKENVTVTVRFRPLSPREIRQGEEIAWYADGETIVRNEHNQSIAYAYDRVFGPTTTTRHVYDVAAQHVVNGAMKGTNGTIFAYGVTSSGKTHTMHGDQRSPGIIPLAVKDAFSIIQEVLKEASRLYAASWVRDIGPELRPNDYKKQGDAEPKKQAKETEKEPSVLEDKETEKEPSVLEDLAVAARGGMETLRPALHRVYMTRASQYKDALASFIKGYHEGVQQIMQSKEESEVPADESDKSKDYLNFS